MITLTLVRHGESEDNLRKVWSGWNDCALSENGQMQAEAVGAFFSTFPITAIFSSDLKRALWTGQQIHSQQVQSVPPLTQTKLLREQFFGDAEGQTWTLPNPSVTPGSVDPLTGARVWPMPVGRAAKLPNGESCDDVAERTGNFFDESILPFIETSKGKPLGEVNILATSHGIAISELIGAIFRRAVNGEGKDPQSWRGLANTAWTRLVIGVEGESLDYESTAFPHAPVTDKGGILAEITESINPPPTQLGDSSKPAIIARVVATNQATHLEGLSRVAKGSETVDEVQKAARAFFGGGDGKKN